MDLNLSGKVALVTGAARGIGEGIASRFIAEGAKVAVADVDEIRAQRTLEHLGPQSMFVRMDVTNEQSVQDAVDTVTDAYGQIDILVNNAGVSTRISLANMTYDDFDYVFKVNTYGTFLVTRAVIPQMIERKHGKIVNIAAMVGASPMQTFSHYSASKAAVIAFTKAVAMEHAEYDLNINCVCPGGVDTRLWSKDNLQVKGGTDIINFKADIEQRFSLGRAQKIEDIANMVCYLSSDLTQNISGQNFFVTS
ncbi:SDR family NAD(P)-dependent oxidoreductase [Oceanidesulfovibrio marinus]|uniref:SDR family oxidoreductase n=1 Tax=Oceanidesulfovibrio marinus TaxID=370038 RepID=A0A6P1ZL74_9BACT|nr:SDR family oxidoreductase [Oceanidesulfovibrio marinus]QJT09823.1 SDR family oxidoreductase [Oceanidesulfovibrio marinus]TVM36060.1 short-chain dehydrogenase [Oceanidesulfovibrio marinus]